MALLHRRQIVNQDNLKDYLENISEFRLGRIIRKGREVKNNIVYVEKSENGFLSDRVRLRHSASSSSSSVDHEQQQSPPFPPSSSHGRRIWVAKEILMCSGHVNCQRDCGGMGSCLDDCLKKDEKRAKSGHRCSFRVNIRMYLHNIGNWEVDVMGRHVPPDHVWIPPKKDFIKKMKLNPSRLDTQTHLSMIVPKIETLDQCEDVTSQNVYAEQTSDSIHIGNYCSTNYERQKSSMSLDSISYPVRDDLENEEALDLTQNQKSTLNSKDDHKESDFGNGWLSTNKILDKGFNSPTRDFSKTLQTTETLNNHDNLYSQKFSKSLGLFKEAVKLSDDGMQVFVIVSGDKNSFSYWGTKDFSDKFTSSQPLAKYDAFTCYNVFEKFTMNTNMQVNNYYDKLTPIPSLPTTLRAGHLKIPSIYSLKKRSSLSFISSSPRKKKRQSEYESNNHLQENKVRKSKSKSLKSELNPQNCEKISVSSYKKEVTDMNDEIPANKKAKNKSEKCESNVAKDGMGSSLLQRERSQALLRILMSRKKCLMKSETNESFDEQKLDSMNCNRKSNSNRQSPGLGKGPPALKHLLDSNLENDKTQIEDSRDNPLEPKDNEDTQKGHKKECNTNKEEITIPKKLIFSNEKKKTKTKNVKKSNTKTKSDQIS